jgi:hypothetical protein
MDTKTLMDVVAMLDARINKMYYQDKPELANDDNALPWELDQLSGAILELMNFRDHLQIAIDADIASIEQ